MPTRILSLFWRRFQRRSTISGRLTKAVTTTSRRHAKSGIGFPDRRLFQRLRRVSYRYESRSVDLASVFDVAWREAPRWPIEERYAISLAGRFGNSEHGTSWNPFESGGPPLKKHLYLRFHAATNAPPPYQVYWQIVNTGGEAVNSGSLRGEIVPSSSVGAGGLQITDGARTDPEERTLTPECTG